MKHTLERMNFAQVESSLSDERVKLASEAREKLGYDRLAKAILIPGSLMLGLRQLGIEPFRRSAVEAYMAKKVKVGMWSNQVKGIKLLLCAAVLSSPLYSIYSTNWVMSRWYVQTSAILLTLAVFVFTIWSLMEFTDTGSRTISSWKTVDLNHVDVPEYVLQRAIRIKEQIPRATLSVIALFHEHERQAVRDPDPFLQVSLGSEVYFIDVWDEKEFEKSL